MKLQLCVDIKDQYLRSRSSIDSELKNSYKWYCKISGKTVTGAKQYLG